MSTTTRVSRTQASAGWQQHLGWQAHFPSSPHNLGFLCVSYDCCHCRHSPGFWATTDWCWFSFQHIPYVFSLVYDCMLFFLWCVSVSCDSQTLLESLSKRSVCCVLRPHPCWVVAGHTQAPASSIFTLWLFSLTTILVPGQRAPLTTPKEEGEHT